MTRILHVALSDDTHNEMLDRLIRRPAGVRWLRHWLMRNLEQCAAGNPGQGQLFGRSLLLDDDVVVLLMALSAITGRPVENLLESSVRDSEDHPDARHRAGLDPEEASGCDDDTHGRVAELLDLMETLFEEMVASARRLGAFPAGDEAELAMQKICRQLRRLLTVPGG